MATKRAWRNKMQRVVTIDPSIAVVVHIEPVYFGEETAIYFNAKTAWLGDFDFKIFNSEVKNYPVAHGCTLTIANQLMTLFIKDVEKGTHYYEIWTDKRIIFKGKLRIA
jgi:hypothetical protein